MDAASSTEAEDIPSAAAVGIAKAMAFGVAFAEILDEAEGAMAEIAEELCILYGNPALRAAARALAAQAAASGWAPLPAGRAELPRPRQVAPRRIAGRAQVVHSWRWHPQFGRR